MDPISALIAAGGAMLAGAGLLPTPAPERGDWRISTIGSVGRDWKVTELLGRDAVLSAGRIYDVDTASWLEPLRSPRVKAFIVAQVDGDFYHQILTRMVDSADGWKPEVAYHPGMAIVELSEPSSALREATGLINATFPCR